MAVSHSRPKNLDLLSIRLPLPGVVSILHRLSGALLFLVGLPITLFLFRTSMHGVAGFDRVGLWLAHPFSKLVVLGLSWALIHHFCAGIRFLLLDIHQGVQIDAARNSSRWVLAISLFLTLALGVKLW